MLILIGELNGQKIEIPVTADVGAGNPVGTIIITYSNTVPSNCLPMGTQFDRIQYPLLYEVLGSDTIPSASSMGLPTLTTGQYVIKATSGLTEGQQDDVANLINKQRSYTTTEHWTGKYWIDGSKIYSVTIPFTMTTSETYKNIDTSQYNIRETITYEIVGNSFKSYYASDTDKLRAWRLSAQYMQIYCGAEYPTRPFSANLYLEYIKTTD